MPAKAHLRTDEYPIYKQYSHHFASHETVKHSKEEYMRAMPRRTHWKAIRALAGISGKRRTYKQGANLAS
jgi:hypothetical protein